MITEQKLKEINALIASLQKQRDEAYNVNAQLMAQIQILSEAVDAARAAIDEKEEDVKLPPKRNGKTKAKPNVARPDPE